jgi:predicted PurR-regulated permease PerM
MSDDRADDNSPPTMGAASAGVDKDRLQAAQRFFFAAASAALVVAALHYGEPLLMPLAFAALLAFVLDPLVTRLRRWGLPLGVAVTLVIAMTLAAVGALATLGAQQISALSRDLPAYQTTIEKKLRALRPTSGDGGVVSAASRTLDVVERELSAALESKDKSKPRAPTRVLVEAAPTPPLRALGDMARSLLTPLATAGLIIVLLAYMLAQRREISDRLIRLVGGDVHRMADALNDAGGRVSRYLVAQLQVNAAFGAVLALGLWLIGVPGALLWGAVAAALRFIPYVGSLMAAVFPLLLAFAVDPGWTMVMWTAALILALDLLVANVIEPMAYGGSTGVSPVAVLLSAAFWVLVWGPIGLVLATPLTVCTVVLGRHLGALKFLDVLLSADPSFDRPTLLYQRLISGDEEEAIELAVDEARRNGLREFYSGTAVPMLALAAAATHDRASAKQRHRVQRGVAQIIEDLREDHAGSEAASPDVLCVGARDELDTLSAEMLAHALAHGNVAAQSVPAVAVSAEKIGELPLDGVKTVVLCGFHPAPAAHARFVSRRLRRRSASLRIVLAAWAAPSELLEPNALTSLGVDGIALTLGEAVGRVSDGLPRAARGAETPGESAAQSDALALNEILARTAQRAAEVFRVALASVVWRGPDDQWLYESAGLATWTVGDDAPAIEEGSPLAMVVESGKPLTVADTARVPEFADGHGSRFEGLEAFAGVPLKGRSGAVVGALAVHSATAREFGGDELELLAALGVQLRDEIAAATKQAGDTDAARSADEGVARLAYR